VYRIREVINATQPDALRCGVPRGSASDATCRSAPHHAADVSIDNARRRLALHATATHPV